MTNLHDAVDSRNFGPDLMVEIHQPTFCIRNAGTIDKDWVANFTMHHPESEMRLG